MSTSASYTSGPGEPSMGATGSSPQADAPASVAVARRPPAEATAVITDRESRIRQLWAAEQHGTPDLDADDGRPTWYQLMMFPYPSAAGLHVGNLYAFTGNDIRARWARIQGYRVFQPVGFDAFGIHSENYALSVGRHPAEVIPENIAHFRDQMSRTGLMVDWTRVVDTTSPDYYRWTQWVFTELLRSGDAYQREGPVNWCPRCGTVIANEQVSSTGTCERHPDTPVETRLMRQWYLAISRYAPELLELIRRSDWSAKTLEAQRQWIGETPGIVVRTDPWAPAGAPPRSEGPTDDPFAAIFSARPEDVMDATMILVAPEHPWAVAQQGPWTAAVAGMSVIDRRKSVTAPLAWPTSGRRRHPVTGARMEVVVTTAMLQDSVGGMTVGAPSRSARDAAVAEALRTPGRPASQAGVVDDVPRDPVERARALATLVAAGVGVAETRYRLNDWCISRQRYWGPPIPVTHCDACGAVPVPAADLPVRLPEMTDIRPAGTGQGPLASAGAWIATTCGQCGGPATRETDVSDTFLDSAWYFLRYPSADIADRAMDSVRTARWSPVSSYIGGNEHAVLHLLYARYIALRLHHLGHTPVANPFAQFRAHGLIIKDGKKMSKSQGNIINPDAYISTWGADTLRTYLMALGPYDQGGDFRDESLIGVHRFLERLAAAVRDAVGAQAPAAADPTVVAAVAEAVERVATDIPALRFNTAISALMTAMNVVRAGNRIPHRSEVEPLVIATAPFAPHLGEELWRYVLGHARGVFDSGTPVVPGRAQDAAPVALQTLRVTVNGKLRGTITLDDGSPEEAVIQAARQAVPALAELPDEAIHRTIVVQGRTVNFVVPSFQARTR